MAKRDRRHPANAPGAWFVDDSCIDCDASRQCAPELFVERDGQSVVARQPESADEIVRATRALFACPTGSIGVEGHRPDPAVFPERIDGEVYYCGYNARESYGANAFFARTPHGNLLVDAPRFVKTLVQDLETLGGVAHILITHRDDVGHAARLAAHFGARVYIHEDDRRAAPFATDVLHGLAPTAVTPTLLAIPLPGHTRGSVAYLLDDTYLFSGDSLYFSRAREDLAAFRHQCWYSWSEQARSLERLAAHRFSWVLAGHGGRAHFPVEEMRRRLLALVDEMARETLPDDTVW